MSEENEEYIAYLNAKQNLNQSVHHLVEGSESFFRRMGGLSNSITCKKPMPYRQIKRKLDREQQAAARRKAKKS